MSSDLETEPGSQVVVAQAEAVTSYNEEAETFAVQHRVNKLKQHHRRWVGGIVIGYWLLLLLLLSLLLLPLQSLRADLPRSQD